MDNDTKFPDHRLGVFCCGHVFRRQRRVKLVGRQDEDWQFLCGENDHSDPNEPYHVSVGVLLDVDPTLNEVADLPAEWEAEREEFGSAWIRTKSGSQSA
jgi:hypothetical protein